jgi:hypothetical protein
VCREKLAKSLESKEADRKSRKISSKIQFSNYKAVSVVNRDAPALFIGEGNEN